MRAKQPFRDRPLDGKPSIIAEPKSRPRVIPLAPELSATPHLHTAELNALDPINANRDTDDSDLPSFPGGSWFGG